MTAIPDDQLEVRRSTGVLRRSDAFAILGSAVAAISLSAWLMTQLLIFQGILPFIGFAYLFFLIFYAVVTRFDESSMVVRDRLVAVFVHSFAILLVTALAVVVIFTFVKGWDSLHYLNFFTMDMSRAGPLDPLATAASCTRSRGR